VVEGGSGEVHNSRKLPFFFGKSGDEVGWRDRRFRCFM